MKYANKVSSSAHQYIMKKTIVGINEYQIESMFISVCTSCGLRYQAYIPIVGTGKNSAILHYNANNRVTQKGDLVLVDAAGEFYGYAADITRTFPVNGIFSERQTIIYNAVLRIQKQLIEQIKPGCDFNYVRNISKLFVIEELMTIGILKGSTAELQENNMSYYFYPHGVGHLLGLDVHDLGLYPFAPLVKNNVVTIEPGIYFNDVLIDKLESMPELAQYYNKDVLEEYRGFGGVRIEDDVLVTDSGSEILTTVVKEINDIQNLMSTQK